MDLCSVLEKKAQAQYFGTIKVGICFRDLIEYMRLKQRNAGYKEINTPEITRDKFLYGKKSGHWEKFGDKHVYL